MKIKATTQRVLLCLMLSALLFPAFAGAVVREVTLFPDSARVSDVIRAALQRTEQGSFRAVVTLPAQTLPESLTARLAPHSPLMIAEQSWRQISQPNDGRLGTLDAQLQSAKGERIGMVAEIQALEAQILFWRSQAGAKAATAAETAGLAAQIGTGIRKETQQKLSLEPELEKIDKRIRELQEEIARIAGQKEKLWEVTLLLTGPAEREADITLTYTLKGCGWLPLYRLDARPREGSIHFSAEAEIWQGSGIDWAQVDTRLATLQPPAALAPPLLPPWIIRPRPEPRLTLGHQKAGVAEAPMAAATLFAEAQDAAPLEIRQTTYAVWTLGNRTIPAGSRQRVRIRDERWSADFTHLLRPSVTSQAFLQASVKLPEGSEAPAGTATFLIDGALLGKRPFAFAGQEGLFSFGTDPLVTATSRLLARKSGEKGLIVDRQTQEWVWRTEIVNGGAKPIRIRLEEPLPQPRDERIRITVQSDPEAGERSPGEMIWQIDLPGGQKRSLTTTVHLEAPSGMELDLGWRR